MKKNLFTITMATIFIAGSMLTGCGTSEQKVDAAEENVEEAKEELKEAKQEEAVVIETKATEAEWKVFKKDSNEKIAKNNAKIKELKEKMERVLCLTDNDVTPQEPKSFRESSPARNEIKEMAKPEPKISTDTDDDLDDDYFRKLIE